MCFLLKIFFISNGIVLFCLGSLIYCLDEAVFATNMWPVSFVEFFWGHREQNDLSLRRRRMIWCFSRGAVGYYWRGIGRGVPTGSVAEGRRRAKFDARAMSPRGDSVAPPAQLATLPPTSA